MGKFYRIIDANINRASEGIRVLEDLARFYLEDKDLSKRLKEIRHGIRKEVMDFAISFKCQRLGRGCGG